MSCDQPIDAAVLADYWLALLPAQEEATVEHHLFECDSCGDRLREVIALAGAVRDLARQGSLMMVVNESFLKHIAGEGLRVREYAPPRGGIVSCTVTADDDFLIGRLAADLTGAERVDLCFCDHNGVEQQRLADIPFQSRTGNVMFQQPITYAKAAASGTVVARLVALDARGTESVLGEYTFNHTRSLPGPGI